MMLCGKVRCRRQMGADATQQILLWHYMPMQLTVTTLVPIHIQGGSIYFWLLIGWIYIFGTIVTMTSVIVAVVECLPPSTWLFLVVFPVGKA